MLGMFDVYVKGSQFLVIRRGSPIPADLASGWKKKRAVRHVSEEIKAVVVRQGFCTRSNIASIGIPSDAKAIYASLDATLTDRSSPHS
jgi:hypothetical protein